MIIKLSKTQWKKALNKYIRAQYKVRNKIDWDHKNLLISQLYNMLQGWQDLPIVENCSYCRRVKRCEFCSLYHRRICKRHNSVFLGPTFSTAPFWDFVRVMIQDEVDWIAANELVDMILNAIRQDGIEWGHIKENKGGDDSEGKLNKQARKV